MVCLVGEAQAEAMNVTAIDFPAGVDELAQAGLATQPSTRVAVPRIAGAPVAMECELLQTVPLGEGKNTLVLGRVLAMHVADAAVQDQARCYIDTPALQLVVGSDGAGR